MRYTWDAKKATANIRKHGISFERATEIFDGPTLEEVDGDEDHEEERIKATGLVQEVEVLVVYTDRAGGERRIISARKATRREREAFRRALASSYR